MQRHLVDWACENLARPGFRFSGVDVSNARYNPDGSPDRSIPADAGSVDVFDAYSVFSHMLADDTRGYLRLIGEILAPGGAAWVTCFVEEGVEPCVENPEATGLWSGRRRCTVCASTEATSRGS